MIKKPILFMLIMSLLFIKIKAISKDAIYIDENYVFNENNINIKVNVIMKKDYEEIKYKAIINENFDIDRTKLDEHVELVENSDKTIELIWNIKEYQINKENVLYYVLIPKKDWIENIPILDSSYLKYDNKKIILEKKIYNRVIPTFNEIDPPQTGDNDNIYFEYSIIIIISCLISYIINPLKINKSYKKEINT